VKQHADIAEYETMTPDREAELIVELLTRLRSVAYPPRPAPPRLESVGHPAYPSVVGYR
jgi:hypothetical protein